MHRQGQTAGGEEEQGSTSARGEPETPSGGWCWAGRVGLRERGLQAGPGLPEDDLHGLDPGLQFSVRPRKQRGGEEGSVRQESPSPGLARQGPPLPPSAAEDLWVLTGTFSPAYSL